MKFRATLVIKWNRGAKEIRGRLGPPRKKISWILQEIFAWLADIECFICKFPVSLVGTGSGKISQQYFNNVESFDVDWKVWAQSVSKTCDLLGCLWYHWRVCSMDYSVLPISSTDYSKVQRSGIFPVLVASTSPCFPYDSTEPVFVDLWRRPGIDSQPGGPVRNPICRTGPPCYIGWRNRFLGIDSWAP
jgi:hypothetical protein